jgi:hypothetical protein
LRILIDECLPVQVRHFFGAEDDVSTVMHLGWRSLPNGDLLVRAEQNGFDVFVTADSAITRNHDISGWHLAIVVVPTNRRRVLEQLAGAVRDAIRAARSGEYRIVVQLPRRPPRSRRR